MIGPLNSKGTGMAVFEANGFAINTAYVTVVGEIKGSKVGSNFGFHINIHGRDGLTLRYGSEEEATEARAALIKAMSGKR